ncbi:MULTISPECIES: sigma-70 family RNA polymerase sigma factor [Crossiella]|uniref:RNA polymerase sigma-70 factor (ECF subfamily) n=1 Tax=Crossiella cryophila TaxID=43355 RepID=A0A7W7CJ84_9PSEU|nr:MULTISPECIES: sigma-70 family RNA polymerase sigma factor [Crossiella]MBB4680776.1 RNA polymerase sigma-70 factor (ECF subfamily) [Crossiella cryophila]MCK2243081.1 sigma-70 family RNA polymerase sigma factor [Crossiella sp. S99.2]MCK2256958.1 sigma-70 family RNA polymerase sigma factor [Crossiella sp. S99.1]
MSQQLLAHHRRAQGPAHPGEELVEWLNLNFGRRLLRFTTALTGGDRQWAEDVVQETWLRAWRNAGKLRPETDQVLPWLFTVARRIVVDGVRQRRARPTEVDLTQLGEATVRDEADHVVISITVADALNQLSKEHRDAIRETYLRDRTVNEAARILGVPPGTVKSRVYYGLRMLNQLLQERGVTR